MTSKKKSSRKDKKKQVNEVQLKIIEEISGLVLILVGVFGLYSLFSTESGSIGDGYSFLLLFLLGKASYLLTAVLTGLGIYIIVKGSDHWKLTFFPALIIVINASIVISIADGYLLEDLLSRDLLHTALNNSGGGLIGVFFASLLNKLFSIKGTIIVMVISSIIAMMLITRKPIYEGITEMIERHKQRSIKLRDRKKSVQSKFKDIRENRKISDIKEEIPDEEERKTSKGIKIMDYSAIRSKKEDKPKKTDKSQQKVEEKIKELDENSTEGPLVDENTSQDYVFPPITLLKAPECEYSNSKKEILNNAQILENTLNDFGVHAKVVEVSMGPSVTRYELHLEAGVKVSKIVNLSNDLALSLATTSVRIEAPIPGKSAVGIEVPNKTTSTVNIREVLDSKKFKKSRSKICFALGKELSGNVVVGDLASMPHLLIAGATGSGKSVCINSIITSILYKAKPDQVKLILIDPKMVELNNYNGIPHLLIPVVTDPKHASGALNWAIREMTERYKLFKDNNVRDIISYNEFMKNRDKPLMPRIVIIIDELADLMMVSPREVENAICRLAQLARAAGIHLVLATQRPSVDVITGLIKANVPSRISFAVSSMVDSRTILDMGGAEKLLGRGDMLYHPVGEAKPIRIQGTFISDREVENVVSFIKKQGTVEYNQNIAEEIKEVKKVENTDEADDEKLSQAIAITLESDTISTSMIQRKLRVGYARAGRIIDEMEERGIISGPEGSKPRKVLLTKDQYYSRFNELKEGEEQ